MWLSAADAIYMLWAKPRGALRLANANFGTTITPHVAVAPPDESEMLWVFTRWKRHPADRYVGEARRGRRRAVFRSGVFFSSSWLTAGRQIRTRSRARQRAPIRSFGQPQLPREEICLCLDRSIECRARIFENAEVAAVHLHKLRQARYPIEDRSGHVTDRARHLVVG